MKNQARFLFILSLSLSLSLFIAGHFALAESRWSGVDEKVVEKFAEEHGRIAWRPFINTDQGDLLLFVFLLGGAVGGFVLGYNFRKLFTEKDDLKDAKRNI